MASEYTVTFRIFDDHNSAPIKVQFVPEFRCSKVSRCPTLGDKLLRTIGIDGWQYSSDGLYRYMNPDELEVVNIWVMNAEAAVERLIDEGLRAKAILNCVAKED